MTGQGRVLLVHCSPDEAAALSTLPALVTPADDVAPDATLVVVGSLAPAPVTVAQRAHRVARDVGIAILTTPETDADVRRTLSYAPGVPLDVLVVGPGEPVAERVGDLYAVTAGRRRNLAVLARVGERPADEARATAVRLHALLEHAPLGIVVCDLDGGLLGWNRSGERLLGLSATAVGVPVDDVLPGTGELVATAATDQDGPVPDPDLVTAGETEVEVSAVASELDDGRRVVLLILVDVTSRREAERARDRLAGHVQLLAEVSDVLTRTLDAAQAIELLARSLVPGVGDWVAIGLSAETPGFAVVTVHHRDPALVGVAEHTRLRLSRARGPLDGRVLRGESALFTDADLPDHVADPELLRLYGELGTASLLAVPLRGRTGVLGFLAIGTSTPGRQLGDTDVAVATEVGRRAGAALDNARLYAQQRQLATELQRSLLTDPPQPPGAHIVARYVAAAQQSQVGGDWYDAFVQPDGATVLVIGDVVGHDTRAAAAMGQLRGILRGIAYTTNVEPAEILTRVDAAIDGLLLGTTATAVVARLERVPDDPGTVRLCWSNAGHPPPIAVRPDGRIDVLGSDLTFANADLLLGIDPRTARRTAAVTLPVGSTVLLYTDGLVERRGQSLDEGIVALVASLRGARELALDDLCDTALAQLLPDEPEDDVALVAVRVSATGPA